MALQELFTGLSDAKLKLGVFDGPKIRDIFKDSSIERSMTRLERKAYLNLKTVCNEFLGNKRAENYKELVEEMKQL